MVWPSGKLVRKWSWMRYAAVDRKVPALRVLRFCVSSAWSLAPTAAVKEYPTVQHAISTIYDSISRLCDSMLWWQKDAPGAPESHGISWCSCRGAIWVRWCEIPSAGCVVLWVPTEYTNIRAMDTLELGPTNQQITARSKHRKMIMMTQMLMYTIYIYISYVIILWWFWYMLLSYMRSGSINPCSYEICIRVGMWWLSFNTLEAHSIVGDFMCCAQVLGMTIGTAVAMWPWCFRLQSRDR